MDAEELLKFTIQVSWIAQFVFPLFQIFKFFIYKYSIFLFYLKFFFSFFNIIIKS
jgi:hypothetical protein